MSTCNLSPKKVNQIKKVLMLGLLLFSYTTSYPTLAEFSVHSENWPTKVPSSYKKETEEKTLPQDARKKYIPWVSFFHDKENSTFNKHYIKVGSSFSETDLNSIKNVSDLPLSGAILTKDKNTNNKMHFELGLGYSWNNYWRIEGEYILNQRINFNQNPLFSSRVEILNSKLRTRGLLVNFYHDFHHLFLFKPYLGLILGINWHRTNSTLSNGIGNNISEYKSNLALAWGGVLGARLHFWEHWVGHAGYRHVNMGKVKWADETSTLELEGRSKLTGFNFGISYLF